jgi:hypothetical protein
MFFGPVNLILHPHLADKSYLETSEPVNRLGRD